VSEAPAVLYFSDLSILGGGEICLAALVRTLDRGRFRPVVVAPERGPLLEEVERLGAGSHAIKLFEGMRAWRVKRYLYVHLHLRLRRNLGRLGRLFAQEEVALVHTHGGMYPENIRHLGRIARERRVPVVWECGYGGIYATRTLAELVAPWVDRVIAVSGSVRERLLRAGALDPERVLVLHHGLDLAGWPVSPVREDVRRELGAGPQDVLFGMVGRVVGIKGHREFLSAARALAARAPSARFVIVGDQRPHEGRGGSYLRLLQEEARGLGLEGRLVFAGWREDAAEVMRALDVLVQPSHEEAFGRTLLEAMAAERPVIASRAGGMPEVVEDGQTGLLVPVRNPQALAEAMEALAGDAGRRAAMGRAGRARVSLHFQLAERTRRVEAVYEELLAPAESRSAAGWRKCAGLAPFAG
jgi:glycosyltransferase involved in cell wall biosynthesis